MNRAPDIVYPLQTTRQVEYPPPVYVEVRQPRINGYSVVGKTVVFGLAAFAAYKIAKRVLR